MFTRHNSIPRVMHPTDKANFYVITTNSMCIGYSYDTPIAFNKWNGDGWIVRVNDWSNTTGKHLNWFEVPANERIPGWKFEDLLEEHWSER